MSKVQFSSAENGANAGKHMILPLDVGFKVSLQIAELGKKFRRKGIHSSRTVRCKKTRFQSLKFDSPTVLEYASEHSDRTLTGKLQVVAQ
jgi:hypothetical protein